MRRAGERDGPDRHAVGGRRRPAAVLGRDRTDREHGRQRLHVPSRSERTLGWLREAWPDAGPAPVGIGAVDLYLWPVVIRPFGRRDDRYRWPYSFSRSPERRLRLDETGRRDTRGWPIEVVTEHGKVGGAHLHGGARRNDRAERSTGGCATPERARIFSSREQDASKMTVLLREPRWAPHVAVPRLRALDGCGRASGGGGTRPPAPHVVRGAGARSLLRLPGGRR